MIDKQRRPPWVDRTISDIDLAMEMIGKAGVLLRVAQNTARIAGASERVHQELYEAMHDTAHAVEHATGVRRGLIASWPDE